MFFLVSVPLEAFRRIMRMRALNRRLGIETSISRDAPELMQQIRRTFGGRLILLDWRRGCIMADLRLSGASGLAVSGDAVHIASGYENRLYTLRGRDTVAAITHPWFNYIHGIDLTARGSYLLACAGSDLIMEMTPEGEVLWAWFGPEHGYDRCPDGTPTFFDRQAAYRGLRRATSEQAMHVTSTMMLPDGTVLATLFHQGQLIAIDRVTGCTTVRLDGLRRPHGIHARDGGFLLSDTLGHRIVLLDDDLCVAGMIPYGAHWLQDTIATSAGTYLTLENIHVDQMPQPGLSNRIVEVDANGAPLRGVELPTELRLFTVREIDADLADALARSWGASGDLQNWRWM